MVMHTMLGVENCVQLKVSAEKRGTPLGPRPSTARANHPATAQSSSMSCVPLERPLHSSRLGDAQAKARLGVAGKSQIPCRVQRSQLTAARHAAPQATFENAWYVFIVMELCTGGELFDRITETLVCPEEVPPDLIHGGGFSLPRCVDVDRQPAGIYRETSAARIFAEILTVIAACHCALKRGSRHSVKCTASSPLRSLRSRRISLPPTGRKRLIRIILTCASPRVRCLPAAMGIIHRDIKPENFLMTDATENAKVKAADFGLSIFYQKGQVFDEFVGTVDYIAPEILRRRYGKEVDLWAAGVILYILLSGQPPFYGETEQAIFASIQRCKARARTVFSSECNSTAYVRLRQDMLRE